MGNGHAIKQWNIVKINEGFVIVNDNYIKF